MYSATPYWIRSTFMPISNLISFQKHSTAYEILLNSFLRKDYKSCPHIRYGLALL